MPRYIFSVECAERSTGLPYTIEVEADNERNATFLASNAGAVTAGVKLSKILADPPAPPTPESMQVSPIITKRPRIILPVTIANLITAAILGAIYGGFYLAAMQQQMLKEQAESQAKGDAEIRELVNWGPDGEIGTADDGYDKSEVEKLRLFKQYKAQREAESRASSALFDEVYQAVFYGPDRTQNTTDDPTAPDDELWAIFQDTLDARRATK